MINTGVVHIAENRTVVSNILTLMQRVFADQNDVTKAIKSLVETYEDDLLSPRAVSTDIRKWIKKRKTSSISDM